MGWGHEQCAPPSILQFFSTPPIKTDAPHGAHRPLKNEAPPSEKQPPLPSLSLKREAPFHEMILRKNMCEEVHF